MFHNPWHITAAASRLAETLIPIPHLRSYIFWEIDATSYGGKIYYLDLAERISCWTPVGKNFSAKGLEMTKSV